MTFARYFNRVARSISLSHSFADRMPCPRGARKRALLDLLGFHGFACANPAFMHPRDVSCAKMSIPARGAPFLYDTIPALLRLAILHFMKQHFSLKASLVIMFAAAWNGPAAQVEIGSRRELFVDRLLIESLKGVELRLQHPQPAGVALRLDRPWEGIVSTYVTVLRDGERFLMYYRGRPSSSRGDATAEAHEVSCVAESLDGVTWTRPNLGLFEVAGTRDNNVFLVEPKNVTHNFCPFIDTRPGVSREERFKAVGGTGSDGLFGFSSRDGLRWKPVKDRALIKKGNFDSQNIVFWSAHEQRYLCYFRTALNGVRWVSRATSTNFTEWSEPVEMEFGDAPPEHIYINQTQPYFRAPHIYLSLAARFNPGRRALTEEQIRALDLDHPRNYGELKQDDSDAVLLTSRGGNHYDRTFLESFIRPGLDPRNWVARANYPALGVIQTADSELSLYVVRHYGQPSIHIERLTLRLDGFAALHAPYAGGEMITKPVVFDGSELELNVATGAAGFVRVELQDASGTPLPGYSLDDCPQIIGDQINRLVRWHQGSDVHALRGRPVRVRFAMKDADLYSFRFRAAANEEARVAVSGGSFVTVCSDGGAGAYEAFPDVCRLADGRLQCVFYASYTHVGVPNSQWPRGGRISVCRSSDEGKTWTPAEALFDSVDDDRDPSITQLKDGRLICSFFTSRGARTIEARSPAGPWSEPRVVAEGLGVSSPVRELSDGILILGAYYEKDPTAYGTTVRSTDGGNSWEPPVTINNAGAYLDAETDVVELSDGTLFAALRGGKGAPMHSSRSPDRGRSWQRSESMGFVGHCPYLHRTADGALVLAYRQPVKGPTYGTALRVSRDEAKTWSDAVGVDSVIGAYPSMVNLKDGSVLIVYYEEGRGSNIRARRFRVQGRDVTWQPM